jgi:fumarylacetoacetase
MATLNETHDPKRRSWVASANEPAADFPLQNLPHGVFRRRGAHDVPRGCVAIGDQVLDLAALSRIGLLDGAAAEAVSLAGESSLNRLMASGPDHWSALRLGLSHLLGADGDGLAARQGAIEPLLVPQADVDLLLPAHVGDYTDFYASVYHATNIGSMFRPDNPLMPNYKYVPIGYHGRTSSLVASGTPVRRPKGQLRPAATEPPAFGPCRNLDYEAEIGAYVGIGNRLGEPIPIEEAGRHVFGLCILNDWSARDIQAWEYQPLGPFLAKNFATTLSPWIVTMEALAPFRTHAFARPAGDPAPLPYLASARDAEEGGFDVAIEVLMSSARMRAEGRAPLRLSVGNLQDAYWTIAQFVAHHSVNGCNLAPGDLMGSGTLSGKERDSWGSLMELTWRGSQPFQLPTGEERRFIENGDEIIMRARCERTGYVSLGFGDCRGIVEGAR